MKRYFLLLLLIPISLYAVITLKAQETIRVAVAANLALPMHEIKKAFESEYTDISVEIISASSGKLTAQISNYAPFHIFVSADMQYPESLYDKGICNQKPVTITYGKLILWSKEKFTHQDKNSLVSLIEANTVKNIAIAEPVLAPYGTNAKKWLQQQGIWETVKNKMVYGENVGKVNQYIYSESVEIAFTAASTANSEQLAEKGQWMPINNWAGIPHGGMILDYGLENQPDASKAFFNFLMRVEAKNILESFGYSAAIN